MNKNYHLSVVPLVVGLLIGISVSAASVLEVVYPVIELGDCADRAACRIYCADPAHASVCIDFGEKHGILNTAEAARAREANKPGPGGCRGRDACRTYCQNPANQDECLAFALKSGRISRGAHDLLKKVQNDGGPGGCRGEEACREYCRDLAHTEECLAFAEKNGFVKKDVALKARQLGILEGPGGCRGQDACRAHCADPANQSACVDFAESHGFMKPDEAALARRLGGVGGPGGCQGEHCRVYCADTDRAEECLAFAEKQGIAKKEDIARARKFLRATEQGGGPGGCTGEACRSFCEKPENREECLAFAKKNNLITSEQAADAENGIKIHAKLAESGGPGGCADENMCRAYCGDPEHAEECTAFAVAHGGVSQEDARRMLQRFIRQKLEGHGDALSPDELDRETRDVEGRFEAFRQLEERFRGDASSADIQGFPPFIPGNSEGVPQQLRNNRTFRGPGGCSSPAACIRFCTEHPEVCSRPDEENTDGDAAGDSGGHGEVRSPLPPRGGGQSPLAVPRLINLKTLPPDFNKRTPEEQRDIIRKLRIQLDSNSPSTEHSGGAGNQYPFGIPERTTPPTTVPHYPYSERYAPPPGTNVYPGSQDYYAIPEKPVQVPVGSPDYSSGSGLVSPESILPPLIPPVPPPPTTLSPETAPAPSDTTPLPTSQSPLEGFIASVFGFLWQ